MGALSITGVTAIKEVFEPLVPGAIKVPNTNFYRAPYFADDYEAFGRWAADEIDRVIGARRARHGLRRVPRARAEFRRVFPAAARVLRESSREICDKYGVLLVSDEVICAFGRLGEWFGADRFGYQPDMITVAKGLTSGYAPLGALIASDRVIEPFLREKASFLHGITSWAIRSAARWHLRTSTCSSARTSSATCRKNEPAFKASLERLLKLPIVGDVRGAGYFWGIELVKDQATRASFNDDESERLLRGYLSPALFEAGLICRADDRGDPVIQLSPPLIMR